MCGARGSNVGVVEYLAEAVESLNGEATDCTGATALHHAAIAGHPAVITAVANIPRIVLDATDKVSKDSLNSRYSWTVIVGQVELPCKIVDTSAEKNERYSS